MNDKIEIKKILLFLIFIVTGLSIFLINEYIIKSDYGIYNLNLYLTLISIQFMSFGFVFLNKGEDKLQIKLDEINKNNIEYMENKRRQEEIIKRNKKKSIIYIILGNITMIISNLYEYNEIILSIFNLLIIVFSILGIIKYEYKIELELKTGFEDIKDKLTKKDDM